MAKYLRIHEGAGIDRLHLDDLRPTVDRSFALEDYREGFEYMRAARKDRDYGEYCVTCRDSRVGLVPSDITPR